MSQGELPPLVGQLGAAALSHAPRMWESVVMAAMLAVGVSDIVWRKVANQLVISCWALGCFLLARESGWMGLEAACLASLLCFILAIIPYIFNMMGAADVKVFAAFGALVGPGAVGHLVLYAALFAGLLGAVALLHHSSFSMTHVAVACLHPEGALDRARDGGQTMPLTVAFCGGVYAILWGGPLWLF